MSTALEISLIILALSFAGVAGVLIQLLIGLRKKLDEAMRSVEETRVQVEGVLKEVKILVQNANGLSGRVHLEMDEVDRMLHLAREWTERADRVVDGVGSVIEPPVQSLVRTSGLIRAGFGAFIKTLFELKNLKQTTN
ncbi:MAG: DUF948 domain-containing protein [Kiritimatiellia bacterium]